ncbi:type II toxin-antitoxin system RelE/ParE family toxin [Thermodesulfovibrionales bacterium]|nr:type II toxin-antitoxin system RelE/ParE family toxin [Thermodesulfovibrionales bacterium]
MIYQVKLGSKAEAELRKLPSDVLRRVDSIFNALENNPRPKGVKKLAGKKKEGWRIRVGDYRILYRIDDDRRLILIYRIRHRSEVYR